MLHKCPRDVFWEDLIKEVEEAQATGDQVIVLADVNQDVRGITTQKQLRRMGLLEANSYLHKEKPPPTHQCGQSLIDGIFVSPILLEGARGGYLVFDKGLGSDHQSLWLDIQGNTLWGTAPHQNTPAKARRLQCKDPHVMHKYNHYLQKYLQEKQIFNKVNTLAKQISGTMLAKQEHKFKKLNKEI